MQIARKDGVVYTIHIDFGAKNPYTLLVYEDKMLVASNFYDSEHPLKWDCYCHFQIKDSDWTIVDYLPEPYRNWSTINEVLDSYGGETLLYEESWDIVTDNRQYICVTRNTDGTWNTPAGKIKNSDVRFITLTESNHV